MPAPIDIRKKPTAVKIHVTSGTGVDISWADGHASHYDFVFLREECPCASCKDEREKKANAPVTAAAIVMNSSALPMFKPKPRAQSATQVGNYAIQITFSDGHATGIYSYDLLRSLCPCDACNSAFRAATL